MKLTISDNDNVAPAKVIEGIFDAEADLFFEDLTVEFAVGRP